MYAQRKGDIKSYTIITAEAEIQKYRFWNYKPLQKHNAVLSGD
ncbi:MAG: hypothetical protein ACJAUY_001885 [Cognaticolwellia sp.]|jgi:hypothetical protein|tara:strand:+ start:6529 stop:6657 length:129 start_codon:yes stop_codon:yes gene_type:complete